MYRLLTLTFFSSLWSLSSIDVGDCLPFDAFDSCRSLELTKGVKLISNNSESGWLHPHFARLPCFYHLRHGKKNRSFGIIVR